MSQYMAENNVHIKDGTDVNSIMNNLKNRGVEEILITCMDGLSGFLQAIEAVCPHAEIQQCILHQIRNSIKYVSYKDLKKLIVDLKSIYATPDESMISRVRTVLALFYF